MKVGIHPDTATHRVKFNILEDGYNKRWQDVVNFGKWMTANESRVAGWYKSMMTMGPDPKPIRTGATLHTLCVTEGDLKTYKLYARVYGGAKDDDLSNKRHENTSNLQKWINLYNLMLEPFKGKGRGVTMDSAYMGDIMAQIGRYEWNINMVGTAQTNRTGADCAGTCKKMKKGTHETVMWQHKELPLVFAAWSDNNIVKTLSNCHSPIILEGGLMRRIKVNKKRERDQTPVDCPLQQQFYPGSFHLIDKGNGAEATYDLGGQRYVCTQLYRIVSYRNVLYQLISSLFCSFFLFYYLARNTDGRLSYHLDTSMSI